MYVTKQTFYQNLSIGSNDIEQNAILNINQGENEGSGR